MRGIIINSTGHGETPIRPLLLLLPWVSPVSLPALPAVPFW